MGMRDAHLFPFIEPPPPEHALAALRNLLQLGALVPPPMATAVPSLPSVSMPSAEMLSGDVGVSAVSSSTAENDGVPLLPEVVSSLTKSAVGKIGGATASGVTPLGLLLSRLPVEVSIGKMLVLGAVFNAVEPVFF
jgi:HrpA-like RNA helicase